MKRSSGCHCSPCCRCMCKKVRPISSGSKGPAEKRQLIAGLSQHAGRPVPEPTPVWLAYHDRRYIAPKIRAFIEFMKSFAGQIGDRYLRPMNS